MTSTTVRWNGPKAPPLLDRHETPNFEHGTIASQCYKGHLLLATSPQTSLVMAAELGSPRMEDSLPGHRPPQQAARKSCETIVEFKNNCSQRKPCHLEVQGPTGRRSSLVLYFPRSCVACVHEPGDIAAGCTPVNGFRSSISKPTTPSSICSWLLTAWHLHGWRAISSTGLITSTLSTVVS